MKSNVQCNKQSRVSAFLGKLKKQKGLILFLLPAIIVTIVFSYRPMYGIIVAFQEFDIVKGFTGSKFVGLYWFSMLFSDPEFYRIVWYTIQVAAVRIFLGFPVPIIFALLLNEIKNSKFKRTIQTISYLPHFISWVVVTGFVYSYFLPGGAFEQLLKMIGINSSVTVLTDSNKFIWLMYVSGVWKEMGFSAIIYLAALAGIDPTLYEAATIDGANRLKQVLHITIPCILPTVILLFVMNMADLMKVGFDQVYNLQNPIIRDQTNVISTYTYYQGLKASKYSLGTAIGLFEGVISFVLIVSANIVSKKTSDLSLW